MKPTHITIAGPYKGTAGRIMDYEVRAVFNNGNYESLLVTSGKKSSAIIMARTMRKLNKWGRIPIFMRWAFGAPGKQVLEKIDEKTSLTPRQSNLYLLLESH